MGRESGRSRGAEFWRGIFEQWRQSGKAQRTFCLEKQLSYYTFYYWYRKLVFARGSEEKPTGGKQARMPLAEVLLVEPERGSSPMSPGADHDGSGGVAWYEISLPRGHRIRVGADFEEAVLVRLVRALESC